MKKLYFALLVFSMIITSCSPSPDVIQAAVGETQTALPTQTSFPTYTPYPTLTPMPTIVKILVQTPIPDRVETTCKPISDMTYTNMWKSITTLQGYVNQFSDVEKTSYAIPEQLYNNAISRIVHITYQSKSDGQMYSRRYIIYFKEFNWKNAVFSIDGQCWIDPPN